MDRRSEAKANSDHARLVADGPSASVGGWTKTRPGSLGLLPSGPDPVGERYVLRQPPGAYVAQAGAGRKGAGVKERRPRRLAGAGLRRRGGDHPSKGKIKMKQRRLLATKMNERSG